MSIPAALGIVGVVAALLAAALHVLIFWLKVFAWEGPLARSIFGGTAQEARLHSFYAYNQGCYNLFLAIGAVLGAVLIAASKGSSTAGFALSLFSTASMLGAALALAAKSSKHREAAAKQGLFPLIAVCCLGLALVPAL